MKHILFLFSFLILGFSPLYGQELSWRKHVKLAEQARDQRDFAQAAFHFEKAWRKKGKKQDLAYAAAENYYLAQDYQQALKMYEFVKDDRDFPLAPLYYARCLKNDQQYQKAKEELLFFNSKYREADKALVKKIVSSEIVGCDLGLEWRRTYSDKVLQEKLLHLPKEINTLAEECSPLSLRGGLLYFASSVNGNATLLRARQTQEGWTERVKADLPELPKGHLGSAAFSPDQQIFYFSLCVADPVFDPIRTPCDLWAIRRTGKNWEKPVKLPDYLKLDGQTAMHPFSYHHEGKEILLFVSDRKGGKGGLDIWRTERLLNSPAFDFTFPKNLGKNINTSGDEVTPYYDTALKRMYFSSNGWPGVGGQDVFLAKGRPGQWKEPKNIGPPVSGPFDDISYHLKEGASGAFFASNRLNGMVKINTQDFDIWQYLPTEDVLFASGRLLGKDAQVIREARLSLYEVMGLGKDRLLERVQATKGEYRFTLLPGKQYRLEVEANGMRLESHTFETPIEAKKQMFQKDFTLVKKDTADQPVAVSHPASPEADNPNIPAVRPTSSKVLDGSREKTAVSQADKPKREETKVLTTSATGIFYRVQIRAVDFFDPNSRMFTPVLGYGSLHSEYLERLGLTRVLLGDFINLDEAKRIMTEVRSRGFPDAFLVKYVNGRRVTP